MLTPWGQLVGKPGNAHRRMALNACRQTRFFDHAIQLQNGTAPWQIGCEWVDFFGAHHNACVGSVVTDGVKHFAHHFGVAVKLLNARIDDFNGGCDIVSGSQHLIYRDIRALQVFLQDKGQFNLDTRHHKICVRNV